MDDEHDSAAAPEPVAAPPPPPPSAPPRSRVPALCALLLLGCLLTGLVSLATGPHRPSKLEDKDEYEIFGPAEMLAAGLRPEGVAVLRVDGVIQFKEPGSFGGDTGADRTVRHLRKITKANAVKAVVIRVNSPGGTVAASQEIAAAVREVRAAGKKVVISMADVAASGGYYISAPADYVFANLGTITGSIGVITQLPRYKGIAEKVGYDVVNITSGKFKDMGNPFRDLGEDEAKLFERTIMGAYLQFVEEVAQGRARPLLAKVEEIKDSEAWRESLRRFRSGEDDRPLLASAAASKVTSTAVAAGGPDAGESDDEGGDDEAADGATAGSGEAAVQRPAVDMGEVRRKVAEIADGRIYTGAEAHRLGLVDEIGGLQDAIRKAGELSGLGPDPVILKPKAETDLGILSGLMGKSSAALPHGLARLLGSLLGESQPAVLSPHLPVAYLFMPGS